MQMVMNGSVIVDAVKHTSPTLTRSNPESVDPNSAFDAEYAHGSVVFRAIGKRMER